VDPEEYQDIKELWFPKIRAAMFKHEFLVNLKLCPVPGEHNLKVLSSTAGVSSECYASQWLMFLSPISAKASLVVWRVDKKYRIEDIFRFRSVFTQFFLKCLLYLGLAADVTSSTKTRLCLSYRSTTCFLNNFDFRTCNTWHRKLYIPWNLLWQMRLIYLISKIISCVRLFAVPEEFFFPEDLGVFLTVIIHIWPWLYASMSIYHR